jgi:hypothetical protein
MTFLYLGRKLLFLFLSILTIGIIFGLLLAALILGQKIALYEKDKTLLPIVISAMVVSLLLLILAVFASFANKRGFRIGLGIICLVFALCFLTVGIIAIVNKNEIIPTLENVWSGTSKTDQDIVDILQNAFECCGWNSTTPTCSGKWKQLCVQVIEPDVDKYWNGIAGGVIGFAVVIVVLTIVGIVIVCREKSTSEEAESLQIPPFSELLTSDAQGRASRGPYKYTW